MKKLILISLLFSGSAFAELVNLNCVPAESEFLNRFSATGTIELKQKAGETKALARLEIIIQNKGTQVITTETMQEVELTGTSRIYPAKSLGANEVNLIQVQGTKQGQTLSLIAADGLLGPQSTLKIQGIPYRASCSVQSIQAAR